MAAVAAKAPHDGQVRDLGHDLHSGIWLGSERPLLRVVTTSQGRIRGYASDEQLARTELGAVGEFLADDPSAEALPVRLQRLDLTGVSHLQLELLVADRGGPIAVRRDAEQRAVPLQAQFGAEFVIARNGVGPARPVRGVVLLNGPAESLLASGWRRLCSLLIRESGF